MFFFRKKNISRKTCIFLWVHFRPDYNFGNLVGVMLCAVNGSSFRYVAVFCVGFLVMLHHGRGFFVRLAASERRATAFG